MINNKFKHSQHILDKQEKKAELSNPKVWPVTIKMLNSTINPTNRIVFTT